jgi:Mu-like prophage FluMu N-terminal domain
MATTKTVKALRVVSKPEGFGRAGLRFTRTPSFHAVSSLKKAQIELLKAEPMLDVTEVDATAEQLGAALDDEQT